MCAGSLLLIWTFKVKFCVPASREVCEMISIILKKHIGEFVLYCP